MRCFVRSTPGEALISALVVLAIVAITTPSVVGLYGIILGVIVVWSRIDFGPFDMGLKSRLRRLTSR